MADEKTFTQADIDAAVEKAVGPLKDKITEVMDEAKEAKRKLRSASEIKPEDMAALESENDKLKADLTAAQKAAKDAATAKEKAEKALGDETAFTHKLLVQDGLKSALIAAGVKDEDYLDMAAAKFAPTAKVEVNGADRKVLLGDKPLTDAIKEWAASDAGKKVIAAPVNTGGGAGGGKGGNGSGRKATQAEIDAMRPVARAAFFADGGSVDG